jgi:UDP-2-acetamido-2,6-beta-L-arabino-hexul-4-ose reductase
MKIGITGANGFLGFHLRAFLYAQGRDEVRLATRETFADPAALDGFVRDLDGVAHLAGVNRGDEAGLEAANASLASELVAAFRRTGARPSLAFANSTHIERETGYGRGKRAAAERLAEWAADAGTWFANFVLPNIFGEFGRPFYNSVVATFCHQLANGHTPEIHVDAELELMHAQVVASYCAEALTQDKCGMFRLPGETIRVSELLERLRYMHGRYAVAKVIPDLSDPLDLRLFNTLRSYLYPGHYPVSLDLRSDARGSLFEAVKAMQGGQTFLSTSHPGITRGNHYHLRKVERFLVVSGNAEIRVRKLFSGDLKTFVVSGNVPCYVDMPAFHTHSITNVGTDELLTLFWSNEIFDPADADTFTEAVDP